MKTKKPPIVSVAWHDAFSTDAWTDLDRIGSEPHRCLSVGYMVGKNKDFVSVAGTISEDGQGCCVIHIPTGWIKKITHL